MIGTVAGSAVVAAEDDDREQTFVLSDLHVPAKGGGDVLEDLRHLLDRAAEGGSASRVICLGDLFDSYVSSGQLAIGSWKQLSRMLKDTVAAGVSISVLCGNRDFLLDRGFEQQTGCRVVRGGLSLVLDGRKTLALHGEELCLRDHPYQRSKGLLRHRWVTRLMHGMPLAITRILAEGVRGQSRKTIRTGDQTRFRPPLWAVEAALATGAERLLFGHIHIRRRGEMPGGGEYVILPAFDEGGIHLRAGPGPLRFVDRMGKALVDPAPESFT